MALSAMRDARSLVGVSESSKASPTNFDVCDIAHESCQVLPNSTLGTGPPLWQLLTAMNVQLIQRAVRSVLTVPIVAALVTVFGLAIATAQAAGPAAQPSAAATGAPAGAAAAIPEIEHTVSVTDSQNGKMITVAKSDTLIVSLPITMGTGYSWLISSFDPTQLKVIGKPEINKTDAAKPGAGSQQVFRFQPLMSGSGALEIDYVRPSEKSFRPAKVFTITVTVR